MRGAIAGEPYGAPGNASRSGGKFPPTDSKKARVSKRKPNSWLFCVGRLVCGCPLRKPAAIAFRTGVRFCAIGCAPNRCSRTRPEPLSYARLFICAYTHMCIFSYVHMCIRSYRQNPKFLLYHTAKCLSSKNFYAILTKFIP